VADLNDLLLGDKLPAYPPSWRGQLPAESVTPMNRVCCLAAVDSEGTELLGAALRGAGESALAVIAPLDVVGLAKLAPGILIADVDRLEVDPLEMLRRLRFVLPDCIIVVYTAMREESWVRDCHLAGANCLLCKDSGEDELISGLRQVIRSGCWTDPRFAA
jgi:DNA-binding NarL/FixJ family response regulator